NDAGALQAFAVAPDGKAAYAAFSRLGLARLDFEPPAPETVTALPAAPPPTPPPAQPGASRPLADAKKVWEQLLGRPSLVRWLRFSPDGQWIAGTGGDGSLLVYRAAAAAAPTRVADVADPDSPAAFIGA